MNDQGSNPTSRPGDLPMVLIPHRLRVRLGSAGRDFRKGLASAISPKSPVKRVARGGGGTRDDDGDSDEGCTGKGGGS
jgi:hypothetical protein